MNFTKLDKGKIIDAQPGFVDSWNRMVDCWNNFVGRGLAKMLWLDDFHPLLDVQQEYEEAEDDEEETDDILDIEELVLPPFDPCGPSGKEYMKGDDTNIVFTEVTSGNNKGKIKVDVYYV